MRGHMESITGPGNDLARRRHVRGRKPPKILLCSICGVTCILFLGSAVLLAVGYLNPFGSVGLAVLVVGAVLFFGTILFLVMMCLWVERKYPGVQAMSFKIPSMKSPIPKTAYVKPNISGLSPSVPSRTDYTVHTDLPPYTINVPKKVTFSSVTEEQIIEDADKNIHKLASTFDSLLDGTGNQGIIPEDTVTDSPPQTLFQGLNHRGDMSSDSNASTVMKGTSHPFQEQTVTAKKQKTKTHHQVKFDDYPPSASSELVSHNRKITSNNREEPKQMNKGTSALPNALNGRAKSSAPFLTEPELGVSPKRHGPDSTDKVFAVSPHIQKLSQGNKVQKQFLPSNIHSSTAPNAACQREQDTSGPGKSTLPQKDQRNTRGSQDIQRKHLLVNQIQKRPEALTSKCHASSPKMPTDRNNTICSGHFSNLSSSRKEDSHQKHDYREGQKSQMSLKARDSVINSLSATRTSSGNSEEQSRQRARHMSDPSSSTFSSRVEMLKCTEKQKQATTHQGLPQSEQTNILSSRMKEASHKRHGLNHQQYSSKSRDKASAVSPLTARNHQTNIKQGTLQKTQSETIHARGYSSDSESFNSRKLHQQQEVQQTDGGQRSSQSRDASPVISRNFAYNKNNSENRTIRKMISPSGTQLSIQR
ncbi:hypothetical protein XELAEV_18006691mg [Xenopus laevis]|uniref:Uncharacterized protein n=1 Tax=Xenopus laevis TaxID=8355 RepID=A0A974DZR4_XENLA|nr:hypothetical protein XELAEV_18006691mg [Xenopus laevis]